MAIRQPTQPVKAVAPVKEKSGFGKALTAAGLVGGAAVGSIFAPGPGTAQGATTGAMLTGGLSGAGAGAGLGSTIGSFVNKPGQSGYQTQEQIAPTIQSDNNSLSRRLQNLQASNNNNNNTLSILGDSLRSLAQTSQNFQAEYAAPLFKAYSLEYSKQYGA